jgi:glyoxylase-like metal-dependent hydrolase (beta-lactamase superfamily II)
VSGTVEELMPGVVRLEEIDGTRLLSQVLLISQQDLTIVDAGLPTTPWETIVPTIDNIVGEPESVKLVITHPDADHCGGTAALRSAYPQLNVAAHAADCPPIGSPADTIVQRYDTFADTDDIRLGRLSRTRIAGRLGAPFAVDDRVIAETRFAHRDTQAQLLHIPGHSSGHLGVWIPRDRTLIAGDAVMGFGIRNTDGSILYPPQFLSLPSYRTTLDRIAALNVDLLLCAHEKPMQGAEVKAFIQDSQDAASIIESNVRTALTGGAETLAEICAAVHQTYPGLRPQTADDLAPSVAAVLTAFRDDGSVQTETDTRVRRFRLQKSKLP